MRVLTVVGARPQFVKAATVSNAFRQTGLVEEILVHTGQHFDPSMSDVFFTQMGIPKPDFDLGIYGLSHGAMTGRMLDAIEAVILKTKPDAVLVYGDTNSTLAGALAAVKLHVPIAHVEAGLRSFNMLMPEEVNRILTDNVSNVLFCPTTTAVDNLHREGFQHKSSEIIMVGDVMQDAANHYRDYAQEPKSVKLDRPFILATLHRAENTDDRQKMREIVTALNTLHKQTPVVLPIHPRTKAAVDTYGIDLNVDIIDPVGYLEMVSLLNSCSLVLTDSGGVQKEAYFFGKPCVTMRDETEWVELVDAGYNQLAGGDAHRIMSSVDCMRTVEVRDNNKLYGGGQASERIVARLIEGI